MGNMSEIGQVNSWRLKTPGASGWAKSVQPGAQNRYYVVSVDTHANEPGNFHQLGGIEAQYLSRLPRMETDAEGRQFLVSEGWEPQLVRGKPKNEEFAKIWDKDNLSSTVQMWSERMEADDLDRMRASTIANPDLPGVAMQHQHADRDGVDAAVMFANRGLLSFATYDPLFADAMCRAWNNWAFDTYKADFDRFKPVGLVQTGDVDLAIKEAQRLVDMGYEILTIPAVVWAQDKVAYNDPRFERLWAALEELGKPIAIHVATGRDPRAAKGNGGAICNFVMGAMSQVIEPFAVLLASGVFERYPNLKIGSVEGGVGWVPWLLETLDYVYHTHHMWVRPTLKHPPSHYYRQNCFSSIVEDHVGVAAMQRAGLINNVMWGSDAPHMEGSFPHSPLSLERQLQELTEAEREAVLGLNAVRIFGFDPAKKFCEAKA